MTTKYYTLFVRYNDNNLWVVDFGSYNKSEVVFERQEFRDHGFRATNLKILSSGDTQSEIEALRAKLNYGEYN